jgi:hypothetical protein
VRPEPNLCDSDEESEEDEEDEELEETEDGKGQKSKRRKMEREEDEEDEEFNNKVQEALWRGSGPGQESKERRQHSRSRRK